MTRSAVLSKSKDLFTCLPSGRRHSLLGWDEETLHVVSTELLVPTDMFTTVHPIDPGCSAS
jgi:hypothetical protein